MINCNKCDKVKFKDYTCFEGKGDKNAEIIFIAEAPTFTDYSGGSAFSGNVDTLITELLDKAGINKKNCYFTYLVKCPPIIPGIDKKRKPLKKEMNNCFEHLEKELNELTNKKIIVLMGSTPLKYFTKYTSIIKSRGIPVLDNKYKIPMFPLIDPLMLMRDISHKNLIIHDLKTIKDLSEGKTIEKLSTKYYSINNIGLFDAAIKRLNEVDTFSFDLETTGLDVQEDKIIGIGFSWKERTGIYIPLLKQKNIPEITEPLNIVTKEDEYWGDNQEYVLNKLKEVFKNSAKKILQNAKFDISVLKCKGFEVNNFYFDTMIAHYLLDENAFGMHGLKTLANLFTDMGDYEKSRDDFFDKNKRVKEMYIYLPQDMISNYCISDVDCTFRLYNSFKERLEQEGLCRVFYDILMPLVLTLSDAEIQGCLIDIEKLEHNKKEMLAEQQIIHDNIIQEVGYEFNLNSPKQMSKLLFEDLNLPHVKKTTNGNWSTDESVLDYLEHLNPIAKKIVEHRKISKLINTFVVGIQNKLDKNNKLHTNFSMIGTVTGRLNSSQPNLMQIPRDDKRIKNMFISPPGYRFIEADYSQAEFRMWCNYSQDPQMMLDIRKGLDIHKIVAAMARGIIVPLNVTLIECIELVKGITKQQRQQAKTIVFGSMFGRGAKSVAIELGITEKEAWKLLNVFFGRYPKAKLWIDEVKGRLPVTQQIRSMFGRIRRLPNINCNDWGAKSEAERQVINAPIASAASDLNCNAANKAMLRFKQENLEDKLILMVHDSQMHLAPENNIARNIQIIKEEMLRPVDGLNVPMAVEVKEGTVWGNLKLVDLDDKGNLIYLNS